MQSVRVFFPTENTIMTVRRYSINSGLTGVTMSEGRPDRTQQGDSAWGRLQDVIQHKNSMFGSSSTDDEGKVSSRHSLQEYVHKNRYTQAALRSSKNTFLNRTGSCRIFVCVFSLGLTFQLSYCFVVTSFVYDFIF